MEPIVVTGTQLQLAVRPRVVLDVTAAEPESPGPNDPGDWYNPEKYPLNPNGYVPVEILTPQVPVREFNGPPG